MLMKKANFWEHRIERIVSVIIFIILVPVFSYLYYWQMAGRFPSDLCVHLSGALNGEGYSLLSKLYYILYYAVNDIYLIAIVLAVVSASQPFIIAWVLKGGLVNRGCSFSWYTLLFGGICLTFVCEIYIPVLAPYFYRFSSVTQPWHNQTYIFMKIFSLGALV